MATGAPEVFLEVKEKKQDFTAESIGNGDLFREYLTTHRLRTEMRLLRPTGTSHLPRAISVMRHIRFAEANSLKGFF